MAIDNWFQNWYPPFLQDTFFEPTKNYVHEENGQKPPSNATGLLPIFVAFNLMRSNPEKNVGPPDFPPANEAINYDTSKEEADFKIPGEFQSTGASSGFYKYPYTHSLGFPDPFADNRDGDRDSNRTFEDEHKLKAVEVTGPFKTWYRWKTLDFAYPTQHAKAEALTNDELIPENNLPLGIEVYKHRIFLSMPKWKKGVPVTLAQLPRVPKEESPELIPYPNWSWHSEKSCDLITSVFRMQVDTCGRLWVLDSGRIMITTEEAKQHCPPKLLVFDLETDELITKYIFEKKFVLQDGLYSNIIVDIRENQCEDAYAYMADVWRFGIVVFRLFDNSAWRISNHLFYPDPLAAHYRLHHLNFYWMDGVFGMALSPEGQLHGDRLLYFHSMSGYREFYVKTSFLRKEGADEGESAFDVLGQSRGDQGHVSSSVMDDNGIMFHNLVTFDAIGCWDSRKPYKRENLGIVAQNRYTLVFPNDIRLDKEKRQSMWIITNRLPYYLIEGLDTSSYNFRIMSAYTDESIKGTICDPNVRTRSTFTEFKDGVDCV